METPIIKYNLKDRGRRFTGKERNFNIQAICSEINGPACQERVKLRDLVGFYGHWPRRIWGLNAAEGGIANGKAQKVEPAIVSTHLRAYQDGTIEHKVEFLDTEAGQLAARLYNGKTGGFSSAIDEINNRFYGFDYVLSPNYSGNRGYELTMDDTEGMTLDDMASASYKEQVSGMLALYDSATALNDALADTCDNLRAENEQLLSMLASGKMKPILTLDGTAGFSVSIEPVERIRRDSALFRQSALPRIIEPSKTDPAQAAEYDRIVASFSKAGRV